MDGRGHWLDNVFIERLWRSLKYECVYLYAFETGSERRKELVKWIAHYNGQRPHTALGGHMPDKDILSCVNAIMIVGITTTRLSLNSSPKAVRTAGKTYIYYTFIFYVESVFCKVIFMPIIDLVKWNGSPNLLAWKYPFANKEELSTWTQLIVNETQEAYLIRGGVYEGPFRAGRHTLSTENLPVLRRFIGLPFGGRSPFTAEVWFVNKLTNLNIRWGTPEPVYVNDPLYNILIPIRAFGQYGIEVHDSKKILLKLVGTQNDFTIRSIEEYFRSKIIGKISETLSRSISSRQESVFGVVSNIDGLSVDLRQAIAPAFEEYGLTLTQLAIQSVNVPENDPSVQALKTALAEKAAMNIVGYSYQQKRSFDVMETAAGNEGTAGGVMGAGIGFGMGTAMIPPFNQSLAAGAQNMNIQNPPSSPGMPPPAANTAPMSTMERLKLLRELAQLKTDGILTDAEFETEKRRILGS